LCMGFLQIFNDFLTISDPPQVTIYPRDYVLPGEGNKLICLVNNFFPPPVKVKWTKNDVEVTEGVTLSRYYPNKDLTFRQYSTVPIIPQEGDVYSCTVEHKGLSEPETRLWGKITMLNVHINQLFYTPVAGSASSVGTEMLVFYVSSRELVDPRNLEVYTTNTALLKMKREAVLGGSS
uniref:Ig-like domain-containing protein n=1 Tax=Scleropages formosus TaxID=113540 RepID=A0A8C9SQU8_SCLFO